MGTGWGRNSVSEFSSLLVCELSFKTAGMMKMVQSEFYKCGKIPLGVEN